MKQVIAEAGTQCKAAGCSPAAAAALVAPGHPPSMTAALMSSGGAKRPTSSVGFRNCVLRGCLLRMFK